MRAYLFDYPVDIVTVEEGLNQAETILNTAENLHVVTLNPEMLMQGEEDLGLGGILKSAGLVLPDGAGVVWALKKQGYSQTQRLPGIEFSEQLLARATQKGYRVALIGAAPEVLAQAVGELQKRFPGLNVVYSHHGFFGRSEEAEIAKACAATQPQILLVALGVPRQEKWIAQYGYLFRSCILVGVGGSLDVWSGTTQRAPAFFRQMNLEWLYRISSQPWRIKRTYKTLPMFVVKVLISKGSSHPTA